MKVGLGGQAFSDLWYVCLAIPPDYLMGTVRAGQQETDLFFCLYVLLEIEICNHNTSVKYLNDKTHPGSLKTNKNNQEWVNR